jgi:hypothetical protein
MRMAGIEGGKALPRESRSRPWGASYAPLPTGTDVASPWCMQPALRRQGGGLDDAKFLLSSFKHDAQSCLRVCTTFFLVHLHDHHDQMRLDGAGRMMFDSGTRRTICCSSQPSTQPPPPS